MTSIIPENRVGAPSGALVVREEDGTRTIPAAVYGPSVFTPDADFEINCLQKALPFDCSGRVDVNQINAIVSELLAFMAQLRPDGPFDCNSVTNLAGLWAAWVNGTDAGSLGEILSIYAPLASPHFTGNPETPNQAANSNNLRIANTAYVDAAVGLIAAVVSGALIFKGSWDASSGAFPSTAGRKTGWFYKVSVAGTVSGQSFSVGDDLYAIVDTASTSVYAANWLKIEGAITSAEVVAALGYTPVNVAGDTLTGLLKWLTADNLTAHAGGGQASALALTAQLNRIATVTTAADSVKLPASVLGLTVVVINDGANAAQVFGASTDTINNVATATGVSQAAGVTTAYHCPVAGKWFATALSAGGGGAVSSIFTRSGAVTAQADDYKAFEGLSVPLNLSIDATVAANALTVALKDASGANASGSSPIIIPFRDATLTGGAAQVRTVTGALSLTVPASQALGAANGVPFALWLVAIDNGGTVELALVNCVVGGASPTSVFPLDDGNIVSTTAIAAAPNAAVLYSATARASKAMRILAKLEWASGLATAGTWASAPTKKTLFGPGVHKPGSVVQTVRSSYSTSTSTSSSTLQDSGLTATITPTSAANLISVLAEVGLQYGTDNVVTARTALLRGATVIRDNTGWSYLGVGIATWLSCQDVLTALDAPGSAAAQTYKVQFACSVFSGGYGGSVYIQPNSRPSSMLLQEIAA